MDMDMQHGHGNAAWALACSMNMGMQHWYGHSALTRACKMDMGMQHKDGYAPWTWTCTMDMDMHHGHGHAAWEHRIIVVLLIVFSQNFSFYFYSASRTQAADGGRPGLLLKANLERYL
jgi:hypothetical protein